MTRIVLASIYYLIALPVIVLAQRIFQTPDMAGPGNNIYIFCLLVVFSFYLLIRNVRTSVVRNDSYIPVLIHVGGIVLLFYLIFFDEVFMIRQ